MADSTIPLNQGTGGKTLDTESLTGAGSATVERQRVELAGAALAEVARVQNSAPAGTEYALVTRPIAPATTVVSQPTAANLNATVTGSVSVSNLPATQSVTGTVTVGNFPSSQLVSGSVAVSNFPPSQAVTGTFWQETQPITGSVFVSNMPATQPVSGSVAVSNFPASQAVTGTFWQATQPVSGSVTATLANAVAASSSPIGSISLGNSLGKLSVMKTGTLTTASATVDQVILTYTVTTGKTFYLQYVKWQARLSTYAATATLFGAVSLESPAGTKLITEDIFHAGVDPVYIVQFPEPQPFVAGTVIRVVCSPAVTTSIKWSASFGGYEK